MVLFCMIGILFLWQERVYASETLIYSNDFNDRKDKVKISKDEHEKALYNTQETIHLKQVIDDKLTITMWLKPLKTMDEDVYLVSLEENPENSKGIYIAIDYSEEPQWKIGSGSKKIKTKQFVVLDEWVFVALIYDADNHQFRAVLNDTVYRKKYNKEISVNKLYLNASGTMIDDLQVYQDILTLEELEDIKGSPITEGRAKYPIPDKKKYINPDFVKSLELQEEMIKNKGDAKYEVTSSYLPVEKKIDSTGEYIDNLKRGDVVTVKEISPDQSKVYVETEDGKLGYLDAEDFETKLIRADESRLNKFIFTYTNIANDNNSIQTILLFLLGSLAVVTVFVILQRIATKHAYIAIHGLFTPAIYVVMIYWLAKLSTDEYETNWWLQEGWMSFPYGYTEFVHWFLFITSVLFIMVHLVQNAIIIKNCGIIKGIITGISIAISNILGFFMIQMVITLLISHYDLVGLIVVILFMVGCLYYLKVNRFFLKVEEFDVPDLTAQGEQNQRSYYYQEQADGQYNQRGQGQGYGYKDWYNDGFNEYTGYSSSRNESSGPGVAGPRKSQYFAGVTRLDELQTRYRNLMKIYHPDIQCGDTEVSKQIAEEYEYLKKTLTE